MATTQQENFFSKNSKYFYIVFVILFLFFGVKSCNRGMTISKLEKEKTYIVDSLHSMYQNQIETLEIDLSIAKDSILVLNYEVKLAAKGELSANERANAVQSTAEKIKENTKITIENKSQSDTVSVKK